MNGSAFFVGKSPSRNNYIIRSTIDLSRSSDIKRDEILLQLVVFHQPVPRPISPNRQTLFEYTSFPHSIRITPTFYSSTMRFEIIYALFATVAVALPRGGNQEVSSGFKALKNRETNQIIALS